MGLILGLKGLDGETMTTGEGMGVWTRQGKVGRAYQSVVGHRTAAGPGDNKAQLHLHLSLLVVNLG